MEPVFDMPVVNITVREFETAVLPCSIKYLGDHQVNFRPNFALLVHVKVRVHLGQSFPWAHFLVVGMLRFMS